MVVNVVVVNVVVVNVVVVPVVPMDWNQIVASVVECCPMPAASEELRV
jgi:hypothetical protein